MTRAQSLAKRFALGKTVIVSSILPNTREWPGIGENMQQFFCGEELEILDHVWHPDDPGRLAVLLNTEALDAHKNFLFSVDWLSLADEEMPEPVLARKGKLKYSSLEISEERKAELKAAIEKVLSVDRKPAVAVAPPEKPVVKEKKNEKVDFGWGAALGGALVSALGAAMVKQKLDKTKEMADVKVSEEVKIHDEAFVKV